MNIQALMKQAQTLQKDMFNAKKELDATVFSGESALVSVVVKGDRKLSKVNIKRDIDLSTSEDIDMLEDMIVIATNEALAKIEKAYEEKMGKYGTSIPNIF